MASRLKLQTEFEEILGSRNVYFQPPSSVKMHYPAIRYSLSDLDGLHANDKMYKQMIAYEVVLIDPNPDNTYAQAILDMPYCSFDRSYAADNLNHYVFTLYY